MESRSPISLRRGSDYNIYNDMVIERVKIRLQSCSSTNFEPELTRELTSAGNFNQLQQLN